MKNIHILPTDKPSRFSLNSSGKYHLTNQLHTNSPNFTNQSIYITSDEEVKDCWVLNTHSNQVYFLTGYFGIQPLAKKIILTTDQDLIKDGVQSIDDKFLEWFVNNPICESVEIVIMNGGYDKSEDVPYQECYKIIIPKEAPKQERMYSEQEVLEIIRQYSLEEHLITSSKPDIWFEQFKKK